MKYICLTFLLTSISLANAWDTEQLEVFDVVEEVKVNFYNFLSVSQDADTQTIKSAFRRLSLELHPDKNSADNAEEQFRNLVSIYEVLKDPVKRKYYDQVLVNGLPNWKSAVYYYRHVRRVGLVELSLFLFVLVTIGQYLVGWATYLERKFTLEQVRGKKQRKLASMVELPTPSFSDTLPLQIPRFLWFVVISVPEFLRSLKQRIHEKLEERIEEVSEDEPTYEHRTIRKRKPGFVVPEGPTFDVQPLNNHKGQENDVQIKHQPPPAGGLWTDHDLNELVQLTNRYPGGTPNRWEIIAEALSRSVAEVTYMANKLKNNAYRLAMHENNMEEEPVRVKKKTKGAKLEDLTTESQSMWTQEQQKAMENALAKYPKGCVDRWDCIAECVPEKTKEQCILRYKYLVELVKKQKENQDQQ